MGDLAHALRRGLDADVEGDRDVGSDIVAANEAVFALPGDLQLFHRDIDDVNALHDRQAHHPVEGDPDAAPAGFHPGAAGLDPSDTEERKQGARESENDEKDEEDVDDHGGEEKRTLGVCAGLTRRCSA
ncbi:MAG: hypothetical protein IPL39_09095 [Opitutaceae bacterium]|nr:hypothetical protein [Opitutaceae bacterium]